MTDAKEIVSALLDEVLAGSREVGYFLNPGDAGLLRSIDRLSAAQASAPAPGGGASIAAHVDHLRYGLELLNRELAGERAFDNADYAASWRRLTVSDREWAERRDQLRRESTRVMDIVNRRGVIGGDLLNVLAMVAHLAYHLGAIRQIDRAAKGPAARD